MKKNMKTIALISSICFNIVFFVAFSAIFKKEGYMDKIKVKLGIQEKVSELDYQCAILGWENSLVKLDVDADVVFYGDSITCNSDFRIYFPDTTIVNLGLGGDWLYNLNDRLHMISSVTPEKIFILGGVNGLKENNWESMLETYRKIIDNIQKDNPDTELYVQSVLPVAKEQEEKYTSNIVIQRFNTGLETIAYETGCGFVDLYSLYEENGYLPADVTTDGIHLKEESYSIWAEAIEPYIEEGE